jgi:hypothetical protein
MARAVLAIVAALALMAVAAQARELQQTCPVWKCATKKCTLETNDAGVNVWICSACQATYRLLNKNACGKWTDPIPTWHAGHLIIDSGAGSWFRTRYTPVQQPLTRSDLYLR